jgi:large subunit ribosomal protein L10
LSLNRSEKQAVIEEVTGLAAKAQTLVMAEYRGITVADMTKLRIDARSKGVALSVLKNTLARRAVAGSAFAVVSEQMTGPLIYGFSEDPVGAAKVLADFAKTNEKLVLRGGAYAGKALDVNAVKQLANIPSKEVLLAQLCGLCPPCRVQPLCSARWRQRRKALLRKSQHVFKINLISSLGKYHGI